MRIRQSNIASMSMATLTIAYFIGIVYLETNRKTLSGFLHSPDLATFEILIFILVLAVALIHLTVATFHRISIEPDHIKIERILSKVILNEKDISWISSGRGWIQFEMNQGQKIGFKIAFFHKSINSKAIADLEAAINPYREKIQSRYFEQTITLALHGIFSRIYLLFLAVMLIGMLPLGFSIFHSSIDLTDAIIVVVVLIPAALLGLCIPLFMIGPLLELRIDQKSISLKYPHKKVELKISELSGESCWYEEGVIETKAGKKYSLAGLSFIGKEKLSIVGSKWYLAENKTGI